MSSTKRKANDVRGLSDLQRIAKEFNKSKHVVNFYLIYQCDFLIFSHNFLCSLRVTG